LQQCIGEGQWDDDVLLAKQQQLVNETLGEEEGALIVDGSEFPKQGDHASCGGASMVRAYRQTGPLPGRRRAFARRAAGEPPYLTGVSLCLNPGSRRTTKRGGRIARSPMGSSAETKQERASQLVESIMASGRLRAQWIACDEGYGDSPAFEAPAGRDRV